MQLWCGSVLCPSVSTILRTAPSNPHHAASHEADTGMDTRTRELLQFLQEALESALPGLNTKHAKCTLYLLRALRLRASLNRPLILALELTARGPVIAADTEPGSGHGTRARREVRHIHTLSTQYLHTIYNVSTQYLQFTLDTLLCVDKYKYEARRKRRAVPRSQQQSQHSSKMIR